MDAETLRKILKLLCEKYDEVGPFKKWGLGLAIELVLEEVKKLQFPSDDEKNAYVQLLAKIGNAAKDPYLTLNISRAVLHVCEHGLQPPPVPAP